jgi:hypothetical protein
MRNITIKEVLNATAAGVGKLTHCNDPHADSLYFGYKLVMAGANFIGSVGFAGNIEDDGDYANWPLLVLAAANLVTVAPAQITIASNTLAVATGLTAGTQRGLVRINNPPPFVIPRFAYTSGGGVYNLQLKAAY